ncbi:MAG TPA: DMT family transporter [Anaeromyxobacteraceae bacterium]|nr:DMT family transporter [Anaeromyxobacteraceae bacterium]
MVRGVACGLGAALLFGLSTPLAKLLLPESGPFMLAGLLYMGSGLGLLALAPFDRARIEAPLQRADTGPLLGMILAGGIAAPLLLMFGLGRLPGSTASLLLNLEAPFTIALAVAVFGESLSRREVAGSAAILLGGVALGMQDGPGRLQLSGGLAVAGACLGWALDNNLSQRVSLHDPVAVVRVKSLVAGAVNLAVAVALGHRFPPLPALAGALAVGFLGYGASIVLHLRAMRELGTARQSALFATAPFAGALAAGPLLGERPTALGLGAGVTMLLGVGIMLRARHGHDHAHVQTEHVHAHVHDDHHLHPHEESVNGAHSHLHRHPALTHDHPHLPDAHHRHEH